MSKKDYLQVTVTAVKIQFVKGRREAVLTVRTETGATRDLVLFDAPEALTPKALEDTKLVLTKDFIYCRGLAWAKRMNFVAAKLVARS